MQLWMLIAWLKYLTSSIQKLPIQILKDRRLNETAILGVPVKATIKEVLKISNS
ncbi:hypothetical protein AAHE18_20G165900 [Arachis hypogaea]